MYEVIGHPDTRAIRLIWMLEELGASYSVIPAMPQSDEARAINASGKVPVLRDGDLSVPDSLAALYYLADKHSALVPQPGTAARARHDALLFMILDELEGPLWTKARHSFVLPEKYRVAGVGETAKKEYERGLANLTARLGGGDYLTGPDFTIADLLLGHLMRWATKAKFPEPEDAHLKAMVARILNRPALRAADARKGIA